MFAQDGESTLIETLDWLKDTLEKHAGRTEEFPHHPLVKLLRVQEAGCMLYWKESAIAPSDSSTAKYHDAVLQAVTVPLRAVDADSSIRLEQGVTTTSVWWVVFEMIGAKPEINYRRNIYELVDHGMIDSPNWHWIDESGKILIEGKLKSSSSGPVQSRRLGVLDRKIRDRMVPREEVRWLQSPRLKDQFYFPLGQKRVNRADRS